MDQQQQLQLATVADNRRLKDHVQKLSGQLTQKTNDNLSTGNDLFNMANCRMRLASHWQNKKRHCDVSCIILSDQTKMRRYVQ